MANERIEFEIGKNTSKATLYLGGKIVSSVEIYNLENDYWDSGTQAILAVLRKLIPSIENQANRLGIPT